MTPTSVSRDQAQRDLSQRVMRDGVIVEGVCGESNRDAALGPQEDAAGRVLPLARCWTRLLAALGPERLDDVLVRRQVRALDQVDAVRDCREDRQQTVA